MGDEHARHARELFDGIARRYQRPAAVLSFGAYGRWRRALLDATEPPNGAHVLDVATGTGLIGRELRERVVCDVVGVDQSAEMLAVARERGGLHVAGATAGRLPFPDATFDLVLFSYLFRYVPDPDATLAEMVRVVRPRGTLGCVEFGVPAHPIARAGWRAYARGLFPALTITLGNGWRAVGGFLPGSIEGWAREWPVERQLASWRTAGIRDVRARTMTLGAGVVMWGHKDG